MLILSVFKTLRMKKNCCNWPQLCNLGSKESTTIRSWWRSSCFGLPMTKSNTLPFSNKLSSSYDNFFVKCKVTLLSIIIVVNFNLKFNKYQKIAWKSIRSLKHFWKLTVIKFWKFVIEFRSVANSIFLRGSCHKICWQNECVLVKVINNALKFCEKLQIEEQFLLTKWKLRHNPPSPGCNPPDWVLH